VAALATTWEYDISGAEHLRDLWPNGRPVVWALWHGDFLPLIWLHRNDDVTILVSRHRDGDHLAEVAGRWGYRVLRGSSTRGAVAGLLGLVRTLRGGGQVAVAADGPRGPQGLVKRGAVAAAFETGAPIVPVGAAAARAWRLRSWDGFLVPQPWARIKVAYGRPLFLPRRRESLKRGVRELQEQLECVSRLAAG
jgi:lysophospholipid acyltransferase (LPLAT)-like uncharacterized protein